MCRGAGGISGWLWLPTDSLRALQMPEDPLHFEEQSGQLVSLSERDESCPSQRNEGGEASLPRTTYRFS